MLCAEKKAEIKGFILKSMGQLQYLKIQSFNYHTADV